jgi:hypothetical protein
VEGDALDQARQHLLGRWFRMRTHRLIASSFRSVRCQFQGTSELRCNAGRHLDARRGRGGLATPQVPRADVTGHRALKDHRSSARVGWRRNLMVLLIPGARG